MCVLFLVVRCCIADSTRYAYAGLPPPPRRAPATTCASFGAGLPLRRVLHDVAAAAAGTASATARLRRATRSDVGRRRGVRASTQIGSAGFVALVTAATARCGKALSTSSHASSLREMGATTGTQAAIADGTSSRHAARCHTARAADIGANAAGVHGKALRTMAPLGFRRRPAGRCGQPLAAAAPSPHQRMLRPILPRASPPRRSRALRRAETQARHAPGGARWILASAARADVIKSTSKKKNARCVMTSRRASYPRFRRHVSPLHRAGQGRDGAARAQAVPAACVQRRRS